LERISFRNFLGLETDLAGVNDNYERIDPEKRSLETEMKQLSLCRQFSHQKSVSNGIQWDLLNNS